MEDHEWTDLFNAKQLYLYTTYNSNWITVYKLIAIHDWLMVINSNERYSAYYIQ